MSAPFAYYNEIDEHAADWLENLIVAGLIAPGFVDRRSIKEVEAYDLQGFTQHHFFAGIGGWSYACRLAGWPDDRPIWTASCPCQPFSVAGKGLGEDDPRHLWPDLFRLWRAYRPAFGVGEQVAGKAGYNWFNGVRADLEGENFLARAVDIPACAVDAPHQRNRCYWVCIDGELALSECPGEGRRQLQRSGEGARPAEQRTSGQFGGSDAGCVNVDDMPRLGRGEGIDQSEIRRWWRSVASTDGQGVTQGDAFGPRLERLCWDGDGGRRWPEQDRSVAAADGGGIHAHADRGGRDGRTQTSIGQPVGGVASERDHGASDLADDNNPRELQPERRPEGVLSVSGRWDMHGHGRNGSFWSGADWIICHDDKARRVADANAPMLVNGTATALDCLRAIEDRAKEAIELYVAETQGDWSQTMRMVRDTLCSQAFWRTKPVGGIHGVPEAQVLLDFLLCIEAARNGASHCGSVSKPLSQTQLRIMRSVWVDEGYSCSPYRWGTNEQLTSELADPLHSLSFLLARYASAYREQTLNTHAASSRIIIWKGIGNAIVPQEAAEVIGALKDVYWPHEAHPPP